MNVYLHLSVQRSYLSGPGSARASFLIHFNVLQPPSNLMILLSKLIIYDHLIQLWLYYYPRHWLLAQMLRQLSIPLHPASIVASDAWIQGDLWWWLPGNWGPRNQSIRGKNCLGSIPQAPDRLLPLSEVSSDAKIWGNYVGGCISLWDSLPAWLPWRPADKVMPDGGPQATEAQGINARENLALINPLKQLLS